MIDRLIYSSPTLGMCLFCVNLMIWAVSPLNAETLPSLLFTKYDLQKGIFLVATPFLLDPSFKGTVVLICEHEEKGTLGLIVNRPTPFPLSRAFPGIPGLQKLPDTLFEGGPVQRNGLLMIFRSESGTKNTKPVLEGVFWGGDRELMTSMLETPDPTKRFRVYAGYAGWSKDQLENEIKGKFWKVVPASPENIFNKNPTTLWKEMLEQSTHPRLLVFDPIGSSIFHEEASERFLPRLDPFPTASTNPFLSFQPHETMESP